MLTVALRRRNGVCALIGYRSYGVPVWACGPSMPKRVLGRCLPRSCCNAFVYKHVSLRGAVRETRWQEGETITGQKTRKGRQRSRSHASATGADAGNSDDPGLCEASLLRVLVGQVWSKRAVGGLRTLRQSSAEILQRERRLRFAKTRSLVTVRGRSGIEKVSRSCGALRGTEVQLCHTRLGKAQERASCASRQPRRLLSDRATREPETR